MDIKIVDNSFAHDIGMVSGVKPKHFKWSRDVYPKDEIVFYTHEYAPHAHSHTHKKYYLFWESPAIIGFDATNILLNQAAVRNKTVFTPHLDFCEIAKWIPGGGVWISNLEKKIYSKTKLCSIVDSGKRMCELHFKRSVLSNGLIGKCDTFGPGVGKPQIKIIESLGDYAFSIAVENYVSDFYFTEKLLNCFATGTIPIYCGCSNIGKWFNTEGIIQIGQEKIHDVKYMKDVVDSLSFELYNSKIDAIQDNFERVNQFRCIEDYMWNNYREIFGE